MAAIYDDCLYLIRTSVLTPAENRLGCFLQHAPVLQSSANIVSNILDDLQWRVRLRLINKLIFRSLCFAKFTHLVDCSPRLRRFRRRFDAAQKPGRIFACLNRQKDTSNGNSQESRVSGSSPRQPACACAAGGSVSEALGDRYVAARTICAPSHRSLP